MADTRPWWQKVLGRNEPPMETQIRRGGTVDVATLPPPEVVPMLPAPVHEAPPTAPPTSPAARLSRSRRPTSGRR